MRPFPYRSTTLATACLLVTALVGCGGPLQRDELIPVTPPPAEVPVANLWDYLRIRGTVAGHQHQYRLVHVHGEYVPRKVTPKGYVNRGVPALGIGRRAFRRNTLPPQYPPAAIPSRRSGSSAAAGQTVESRTEASQTEAS